MKKLLVLLLTIALGISAVTVPVLAEEAGEEPDQITSATTQSQKKHQRTSGGEETSETPESTREDQTSQTPDQDSQNAQDSRKSRKSETSGKAGRSQKQEKRSGRKDSGTAGVRIGKSGKHVDLDRLLSDGVITREVYDAIIKYMEEQVSQPAEVNT